ncbi:hypothetical protein [Serratia fonticola]
MKQLQLKDAMQRLTITINESGYEVSNQAGTAQYDACGARTTVNGIPEYFPLSISVKDNSKRESAELPSGTFAGTVKALPGKITGDVKSVKHYVASMSVNVDTTDLDKLEAQLKRIAGQGQPFEIKKCGQVIINDAVIGGNITTQVAIEGQIACQNWAEAHAQQVHELVKKAIAKELQYGGALHQAMKR